MDVLRATLAVDLVVAWIGIVKRGAFPEKQISTAAHGKGLPMRIFTPSNPNDASPNAADLVDRLSVRVDELLAVASQLREQQVTPEVAYAAEKKWRQSCGASAAW